jgi:hypothetical protein
MIPINKNKRVLELYSARRNRNIYPNPSSFEVNFAPTIHKSHCDDEENPYDPVCKGSIYYTFTWVTQSERPIDGRNFINYVSGRFDIGSTQSKPVLKFNTNNQFYLPFNYPDYLVGYKIYNYKDFSLEGREYRYITSYDPTTNTVTLNRPFYQTLDILNFNNGFAIFSMIPEKWSIFIPTVDDNRMTVNKTPLYYNGYYVVFETDYKGYSNSSNSNIFSRRISYYDYKTQQAYFDEPLPFDYYSDFPNNFPTVFQRWTLRKSLPNERWLLNKTSYFKSTRPENPLIGPLQGYVVILPDEASSIDNYYKGKYVYVVSGAATTYSPPLPPQTEILPIKDSLYPVYGLFYIRAYNGTTKELSISQVSDKYNTNKSDIPTYIETTINSGDIYSGPGFLPVVDGGGGYYYAYADPLNIPYSDFYQLRTLYLKLQRGKSYFIKITIAQNPSMDFVTTLALGGVTNIQYDINHNFDEITGFFKTFEYDITMNSDTDILEFLFYYFNSGDVTPISDIWYVWTDLQVIQYDIINIVELDYDNYSPLDYNGSIVSANETVCYEMSIQSLTLPNKELLTGSSIAFYPFVYVQIENATSPTRTGPNTIISNNPPSTKALFTVGVPQVNNPELQKFVTLLGGDTQIVKFKPNDNLRFSIYLPNGQPFQTLIPDVLSPYPPDPSLQIQAVFELVRVNSDGSEFEEE